MIITRENQDHPLHKPGEERVKHLYGEEEEGVGEEEQGYKNKQDLRLLG